ncbi:mono-functional DNA-alkylating methyl methanesulfonate N-term-domain-containing protein [Ustulina deusta]|nr:mono-functional DNA-alkylating methyl methanesulfonate N-term-domain-containing protein [Ustulina deusta]
MASLQTHVFVNDEWVTQTVTAEEIIGESSRARTGLVPPKPPKCGVLTRTIIESPIIRWVLPVQLRSPRFNDVALVGDQCVQISEFGTDNQLKPIGKKVYLGSKIRNCCVMGAHDYLRIRRQDIEANYHKSDDVSVTSSNPSISTSTSASTSSSLPEDTELFQQLLVLVLSTGELVFLFMSLTEAGDWEFVSSHFSIFSGKLVDPGFHITISPDWGYMALACSEDLFVVCQLKSIKELRKQHYMRQSIKPIQSVQARAVRGVIHKLEFLHTGSENASHIVLLAITARAGVLRLATYEWENSEPLENALDEEISGLRLDGTAGLPLLIIPLMICCQFLIITEHSVAICSDVLSGSPVFTPFTLKHQDATDWHHGTHRPMWTAWTRPWREEAYHTDTDLIYLAREDGWVNSLEISDSSIDLSLYMGPLQCNIDSGFASVSVSSADILVTSGDNGHGEIWSVEPRQDPKRVGQLPKWSPTVDLVLANDASKHSKSDHKKLSKRPLLVENTPSHMITPGSIFACSGRDVSGAIVQLRYGIQAKIGLDLLYTSPIKRCWAIPGINGAPEEGFFMLLALPENSAVLHISQDLSEVSERDQSAVNFDLLSTTLAVHVSRDIAIQITTMHATIVSPNGCYQYSISDMVEDQLAMVTDAAVTDETLTLSVYSHGSFKIMVFSFDTPRFVLKNVFEVEGEVTAISITTLSVGICILVGLSQRDLSALKIFPINWSQSRGETPTGCQRAPMELKLGEDEGVDSMGINAVTSITCLGDDKIVIGMRNGDVLTIHPRDSRRRPGQDFTVTRTNHFGVTPSHVFTGPVLDTGSSSLVCNDAGLAIMKEPNGKPNQGCFEEIFQVWLTDANEPHSPSPTINSVTSLHEILEYGGCTWAMVAGPHIFITEIQPHPAPVPRYMPVGGTPKGILYSERLEALVTVVVKRGIPSLHFFDPMTGTDLSHPVMKRSGQGDEPEDVDYVEPLGNSDIKIVSLLHWLYKNKGNLYEWFVILARLGDREGRLFIVSAEQEPAPKNTGAQRRIRFWNQFNRKIKDGPPRSGTTDENGLFLNSNTNLEYHVIEDKKFKTVMRYELPSPATCLKVIDGHLNVLTTCHSLIILDYTSDIALRRQRMVQLHTDEVARNGLHLVDVGLSSGTRERKQGLVLTSDPMCGVYGLWPPGRNLSASSLKLVFQAHLPVSIRKFIHGYTRPRWTRDRPRYGHLPSGLDKRSILGLAIDGSLTQFSILDEDAWRLLRYIQNLAMTVKGISDIDRGPDSPDDLQLDPNSIAKIGMHIDGDILQRFLKKKWLEHILSPSRLTKLQELLLPFGLDTRTTTPPTPKTVFLTIEYTYGLLEYYLSPAL